MELGKLGTVPKSEEEGGGFIYNEWNNPLLNNKVWAYPPGGHRPHPMNPRNFATLSAATAIARVLGGTVVPHPDAVNWTLNIPNSQVYGIEIPGHNGYMPLAGNIVMILGNDIEYNTVSKKSKAICEEILFIPVQPDLAERLWQAVAPLI